MTTKVTKKLNSKEISKTFMKLNGRSNQSPSITKRKKMFNQQKKLVF